MSQSSQTVKNLMKRCGSRQEFGKHCTQNVDTAEVDQFLNKSLVLLIDFGYKRRFLITKLNFVFC